MNVGIVLPNWIGDVAMATPALRALRRRFPPPDRLVGVLRPYVAPVLDGLGWLDDLIPYDYRCSDAALRPRRVIQRIRHQQLDLVVHLTNSLRTALIAWWAGVPERVGFVRNGRALFLTRPIPLASPNDSGRLSTVDQYLQLAYGVGCTAESPRLQLAITHSERAVADRAWQELGLEGMRRIVSLNTGGAYGAAKHWPAESFAQLARRLVEDHSDLSVLVLCGPTERRTALRIELEADHPRVTSLAGQPLSIGLTKAAVARSHLMVTTDSGPRHLAAAFRVPTTALFGPTDPQATWNYHPGEVVVRRDLACSPCGKRTCPLGHHRCMRELTVDQVYRAVDKQLSFARGRQAA